MNIEGRVIKSTGSWYKIRLSTGELIEARTRGKMRTQGIQSTNPIAVGDNVVLSLRPEGDYIIEEIQDRKNYIIRKATNLSKQTHIIAANIDLALIMTSIIQPNLKLGFLDRMLVTAEAYNIPALLIFNKTDLLSDAEKDYLEDLRGAYKTVGYESLSISLAENENVDKLKAIVSGKTVLISGHSGVGKSSLVNAIDPSLQLRIAEISNANKKGQHTTTFAELHEVDHDTAIIDTPGLKSFGLTAIEATELKGFFPEMHLLSPGCKFHNCTHINEPKCKVREAFENSELPWFRYEHYLHFYEEIKTQSIS
ncbi:MAG: ribosome small subunit-dependent GTPase A [Salibacteraceae bacterium]